MFCTILDARFYIPAVFSLFHVLNPFLKGCSGRISPRGSIKFHLILSFMNLCTRAKTLSDIKDTVTVDNREVTRKTTAALNLLWFLFIQIM